MQCALVTLVLQGSSHWLTALLLSTPHLLLMHINKTTRSLWGTKKKTKDFLTTLLTFFFPLQQFASGSLPRGWEKDVFFLKYNAYVVGKSPSKEMYIFLPDTFRKHYVWNWPYMYYVQLPTEWMSRAHTRISTLQGSSRGHYNWTLQLALFDKKRRKGNHCILLYSLFFLNPLDSGFRWNWRVISYSSVPTLYPFIRIRRTLIAFPPTTNVLPSCIPASFLFCPIIFHPTNLLFWKMITVHRGILLSTIHSYSDMYPT